MDKNKPGADSSGNNWGETLKRSSVVIIGNPIGVLALNGGVGDVGQMGQVRHAG